MFASFWLLLLIFSYNSQKVDSDLSSFSHVINNEKNSSSMSLLKSIIESFEEPSQIYCVLVIHDDIGINVQSTFLSKSDFFQLRQFSKFFCENFMDCSLG